MKHASLLATETLVGCLVVLCYGVRVSSGIVHIRGKPISVTFVDAPARFAVGVNRSGICGALYVADPLDACSSLQTSFDSEANDKVRFALIARGNCSFEDKVRNAQEGGFRAAIVYDDRDRKNLVSMIGNPEGIWVHAVFVSKVAGETLKKLARGEEGECCIRSLLEETAWTVLVISFISLTVIVSVLATFFFTRNQRVYRQGTYQRSPSVDSRIVEDLPSFTFYSASSSVCRMGVTCAICLEDYRDGETLRVLPCQHYFHASCVDSWLTKWGTVCPVCKHDMSPSMGD
ncbi:receptor homology region, transmembrane domain- and RING domain-containing protein 1-like [Macadamia integrifolia]|uniref:receptor homology region, transmembrane domain- and RING domain-containing protein 1-like n=1 Tax=Macadamia integrifolia TaxID=60698 RepID=UPI001C4F7CA1|nr:receptor homology region, transmembrane domain- and RING domain-containing protein 1-like [Macadamia integrifolia]